MAKELTAEEADQEHRNFLVKLRDRKKSGGDRPSKEEMARAAELKAQAEEAREREARDADFEAELERAGLEMEERQAASEETKAKLGEALGREAAAQARKADAEQMLAIRDLADPRQRGSGEVQVDIWSVANARMLARAGVQLEDMAQAAAHGERLVAERNRKTGKMGVVAKRVFVVGTGDTYSSIVPTITATMLYDYMEFIGGVRASGAEVYQGVKNRVTEFPLAGTHSSNTDGPQGENADAAGVEEVPSHFALTPDRYAVSTEITESMLDANVVAFSGYLTKMLGRSLGRRSENDFHNAALSGTLQKGLLVGRTDSREMKTGGATTLPSRKHFSGALGLLDAAYHGAGDAPNMMQNAAGGNRGTRWLMNSGFFFGEAIVGKTVSSTDDRAIYPQAAETGVHVGRPVGFSSFMSSAAADDAALCVVGNFEDAYLICEDGNVTIKTDVSQGIKKGVVLFVGELFTDGAVRDNLACAYVVSKA